MSLAAMARATRSASGEASSSDDASRCLLLALSHDELGVIVDGLADPLQPVVAVALSSTCLGLRTPLGAALEVLRQRHEKASALCRKISTWDRVQLQRFPVWNCAVLRRLDTFRLNPDDMEFTDDAIDHVATLGMLLSSGSLPRLQELVLRGLVCRDAGIQAFCEGLGSGAAPLLHTLYVNHNRFGPAGADAFAAALRRGAMPKLEKLYLGGNPIGNRGVAALAVPLRAGCIKELYLPDCNIDDEGMASLFANLNKEDFKVLDSLFMSSNALTDKGCAMMVSAIDSDRMPSLETIRLSMNECVSDAARDAIKEAIVRRKIRRA